MTMFGLTHHQGNIVYNAQPKQQQQQQQQQQIQQSPQAPPPLTPQETITATEDNTGQHETLAPPINLVTVDVLFALLLVWQ